MKAIISTLSVCLISIFSYCQQSNSDTLNLEGKILKLPKERFAQQYCITEKECYVLKTDNEEHILNMNHRFTNKLAIDNLNKNVTIKGVYIKKEGTVETSSKKCLVLNLIPNQIKKKK